MARILLIDDSPTVLLLMERALGEDGHDVESLDLFTNLPQVLRSRPPDLIVLDLEMPAISGRAVGPFIRQYQRQPTAVIIHSSASREDMQAVAADIGAVAIVAKTGSLDVLRAEVAAALVLDEGAP